MLRYAVFCFVVFAGASGQFPEEEKAALHDLFKPLAEKCRNELGITMEAVQEAKKTNTLDSLNPCFLGCLFKAAGLISEDGMFDKDACHAFIMKAIKNEEALKVANEIGVICTKVNKEDVSDGNKGCERAILLKKCFKEQKMEITWSKEHGEDFK